MIRRSSEAILAMVIGLVFVALAAFAVGVLMNRYGAMGEPDRFWEAVGALSLAIGTVWLLMLVREIRRMDWR